MDATGDDMGSAPQQPCVIGVYREPRVIRGLANAFSVPPAEVEASLLRIAAELEESLNQLEGVSLHISGP